MDKLFWLLPRRLSALRKLVWLKLSGAAAEIWRTITAAIATFTAVAAPLRQLTVAVEPVQSGSGDPSPDNVRPISGWDSLNVEQRGVNLWDEECENARINLTTGAVASGNGLLSKNLIPVKPNTQYHAVSGSYAGGTSFLFAYYDADGNYLNYEVKFGMSVNFTAPANARFIRFNIQTSEAVTYNHDASINYPATDTAYHAYNPSSRSISITLGSTVYGGTLDVVNGKMTVDRAMVTLTWNDGYATTDLGTVTRKGFGLTNAADVAKRAESISDLVPFDSSSWNGDYAHFTVGGGAYKQAFVWLPTGTAGTQTITICYPLATPFELTITPEQISTLQGTNNVWSDAGDVTVEYRAQ